MNQKPSLIDWNQLPAAATIHHQDEKIFRSGLGAAALLLCMLLTITHPFAHVE
ncbi:MAG: hypothetical protein WA220_06110 [Candidatus Nitrosopolaris sp.]